MGQNNIIVGGTGKETDSNTSLPNQRVSRSRKTKSWLKQNIDFFIGNRNTSNSYRKTRDEFQENWDFYNSLMSDEEIKLHLDPLNVDKGLVSEDAATFAFFDISHQPLDTLLGEELKRQYELRAYALNEEIVNEKDREFQKDVVAWIQSEAEKDATSHEEVQAKMQEFDKHARNDLQSAHEKMANQLIEVFKRDRRINAKHKFNKVFEAMQVTNEEILRVYHVGSEVNFTPVNSKNFTVFGLGSSNWIQDGYAWVEEEYMNKNAIIEEFAEELTDLEVRNILDSTIESDGISPSQMTIMDSTLVTDGNMRTSLPVGFDGDSHKILLDDDGNDINSEGDIKVYRIQWKSLRKLGRLKKYDDFGDVQYDWVDEEYPIDKEAGEEVKWIWVNELYEGVKILDIYLKMRVSPIQMRSLINPSIVRSSYIGYVGGNDGETGTLSRLDRIKPYQRMYNVWLNKLISLWSQNIGKVAIIDTARIPSSMDAEEWYMWLKKFKIAWENSFEESNKGASRGQLAGNMQQNSKTLDLSMSNEIIEAINMLNWIEDKVNKIAAIPDARQGNLSGSEGLGVSQQAIVQSSHQTHRDFFIHDHIISEVYTTLIEYAKYLWKDVKEKRQYLLDDLSNKIIDIDGGLLAHAEIGVTITNSSQLFEMYNNVKNLVHAAMQNGTATLSDVAKMYLATSPSEMLNQLEAAEDKRMAQQQEAAKSQNEMAQQQMQAESQKSELDFERKLKEMETKFKYDMILKDKDIEAKFNMHSTDTNQNHIEDSVELDKERIKVEGKLKEVNLKITADKEMQDKDIKLKEKELKSKVKPTN